MKSLLVPVSLLLLLTALAGDLWAATPPAKIAYVEGQVLVKRKGAAVPVPAELGESLFYGDQVKTLEGKCVINLTASGILRMSRNTTALLPEEPNTGDEISVIRMLQGKTEWNLRSLWNNEIFEVRTPSLVAGVQDQPNPDQTPGGYRGERAADQEIERLRAEGNAKLDAIRAELKRLEGKAVSCPCAKCGKNGPHRWTTDGWECNCGATAASFGTYPTSHGAYTAVRDEYKAKIEKLEARKGGR